MTNRLRIAVMGVGPILASTTPGCSASMDGVELVGIVDTKPGRR
jgi:hypothetical protein